MIYKTLSLLMCCVFLILFIFFLPLFAQQQTVTHQHPEKYYQNIIAKDIGGQTEVILPDKTRIDIVTPTKVIEVDFANKWYEAVGQTIHYAIQTGKKPTIWLIKETDADDKHIERCYAACEKIRLLQTCIACEHEIIRKIEVYVYDVTKN